MKSILLFAGALALALSAGCAQKNVDAPADNSNKAPEAAAEQAESSAAKTDPLDEKYRPTLFAELPEDMYGPDAQCWDPKTKTLYLSVPNFLFEEGSNLPVTSSFIAKVGLDGSVTKLYEFPIREGEVKIGAMGIDLGSDGNLYVCDNQYFFDPNFKSRVWRLQMKDGVPTGEPQLVVDGLKVANAIMWSDGYVYVTDTILDEEGKYGSGGIWRFTAEEFLAAGTDADHPAINVKRDDSKPRDARLIVVEDAENIRGNNCGADGICRDDAGVFYFGNYGDGAFYRFRLDAENNVEKVEKLFKAGEPMQSVDGICFDSKTQKVYITDSAKNAVWAVSAVAWGETPTIERIWENDDTTGADGSLDLPCECRVVDGTLIISNQDVGVGATGKCQATDKPYSLSAIKLY